MKKSLWSMAVLVIVITSSCNILKPQMPMAQLKPTAPRAYVWGIPKTENLPFKNILPQETKVILAYDNKGDAMYVLVSEKIYRELVVSLERAKVGYCDMKISYKDFLGLDLGVSPIGKLSLLTKEQINSLPTDQERNSAIALNDFEKYTLFELATKPIVGTRDDEGKFIPNFGATVTVTSSSNAEIFDRGTKSSPSNPWLELEKKKRN